MIDIRDESAVRARSRARELRALERGRCFGGGGSSSSSSSNQTTNNTDRRQVVDAGGIGVSSDSSTVNTTYTTNVLDGGAIARAFDFGSGVATGEGDVAKKLIDTAKEVFSRSYDALQADRAFVADAGVQVVKAYDGAKGDGTQKFILAAGVVATVGVVAAIAVARRNK